ncbi:MAG: FAD-dependent oxidoreductase [Planctomycetes bacterium]|nr:FAD-dependent oxidoreductase [Planctomycetota bacterium]
MAIHTLIIGGGVVGVSAAYFLARRGAPVTLLDPTDLTDSASTGNAGLIAIDHGPLPRPGLARQAAKWILDPGNPLYIPLRPSLARLRWFMAFHRACRPAHHDHCFRALNAHGHAAGACFASLVADEALDCEYHATGQYDVFMTEPGLEQGVEEVRRIRDAGYGAEVLDGAELRRREPAYRDEVVGAILFTDRAFANPGAFLSELAERARSHGAQIRTGIAARELIVDRDRCAGAITTDGERLEAEHVVLAAGAWSSTLAARAGIRLPMEAGKGYHLTVSSPDPPLTTAAVLAETFVAMNPLRDGLRLAGTLEFSGINHRLVRKRLDMLLRGARRYVRGMNDVTVHAEWCGLRPCTSDGLPMLGWAPRVRKCFLATGHAMMGFALGPLAGRIASECILDGEPSVPIDAFTPTRFQKK